MRRAAALPLVLFVLSLTGGLVVSAAFVTRRLARSAAADSRGEELEGLAEQVVGEALASWDSRGMSAQAVGTTVAVASRVDRGAQADSWITRTASTTWWIVAESRLDAAPALRRRIGLSIQLVDSLPMPVPRRPFVELP